MSDEPGRDETDRDKSFDDAWARIVADYDRTDQDPNGTARWPAQEDLDSGDTGDTGSDTGSGTGSDASSGTGEATPFMLSLGDGPSPARPEPTDDDAAGGNGWVPPLPPPLPRPTGAVGAAWVAVIGGPLLLLLATLAGWRLPTVATAGCIVGFVGGLVFLIMQMDDRRPRDAWDDGAQV